MGFFARFGSADVTIPDAAFFGTDVAVMPVVLALVGGGQLALEIFVAFLGNFFRLFSCYAVQFLEVFQITFAHAFALADGAIKDRLGKSGLVGLVVAESAIAVHVNKDVLLKFLAEIQGKAHDLRDGFRVFAVHVERPAIATCGRCRWRRQLIGILPESW